MTDRGSLEILAVEFSRRIGREMKRDLPAGVGFALLVFDFGPTGNLAYVSSAERASMVKAMKEFIANVEAGGSPSVFGGTRS